VLKAKEESNMTANQIQFCMCLNAPNPGAQKDYRAAILKNACK